MSENRVKKYIYLLIINYYQIGNGNCCKESLNSEIWILHKHVHIGSTEDVHNWHVVVHFKM